MIFEESLKKNEENTRADAGGWIFIILIISTVLSVIIASVATWYFQKENERR